MSTPAANIVRRPAALAAVICAAAAMFVFIFYGNASRGYVDTPSLFWWWVSQWLDPNADSEHGWLILGLSGWLFWRNLRTQEQGRTTMDQGPRTEDQQLEDTGNQSEEQGAGSREQGQRTKDRGPKTRDPLPAEVADPVPETRNRIVPLAAMLSGLAVHALGFTAQQARISILGFLLFTWGVLRLAGGRRWGAAAAFPLAFMVFAIPVNVLDSLGFWLRMGVVDASAAIARAAGIGVVQSGTQLLAPDGRYNYDVAAACSGVRSLTAMVALSLLAGYLNFQSGWRRAFALLLSFPLVYVGNVARIVAIIFAAQLGGPRWGDLAHEVMGFGVFIIVLGGVLAGVALLRRLAPEREDGGRKAEAGRQPAQIAKLETPNLGAALVAICVVGVAAFEAAFLHHLANSPRRGAAGVALAAAGTDPVELPAFLGTEWIARRTEVTPIEREILPADTGFSRKLYVPMSDPSDAVLLSIVLSGRDRTSIHRPELCLVGQGWTIEGSREHRFSMPGPSGGTFPATVLRVKREVPTPRGNVTVPSLTVYWFIGGDGIVATHWQRVLRDSWNRVVHARADRWAYVLMQTDATDGEATALARMQTVLEQTLPVFAPQVFGAQKP